MKVGILFSSGKDSCLALEFAKKEYEVVCLMNMKSKNQESYMFHTVNSDISKLQSKALEIPLLIGKTNGEKEEELKDLEKLIKKAKEKYKIEGVVSGALYSSYQKERVENICNKLNLISINPLWHFGEEKELNEVIKRDYEAIIVSVSAEGLNKEFLGKKIDQNIVNKFKKLKINICGEGGEHETLVLDCPMFFYKINILSFEIIMEANDCGKLFIKNATLVKKKNLNR